MNHYFFEYRFGGGPACTHLFECPICEEKYETVQKRRQHELDVFQRYNNTDTPTAIYALSMHWFRKWQIFVNGKEIQSPGPIDNTSIVINVNGQKVLKPGKLLNTKFIYFQIQFVLFI